jgi:hypothetical protein
VFDALLKSIELSYNYKELCRKYFTSEFLEYVNAKSDVAPLRNDFHKFIYSLTAGDVTEDFAAEVISRTAIALNKTKPEGIFYLKALGRAADVLGINLSTEISL